MSAQPNPPGPPRLLRRLWVLLMRHAPMQFLTRVAVRYGGIVRIPLARGYLFLASEPDLIKALLVDHRTRFIKNTRYSDMQRVLGQGLLLSEAEVWRRQRLAAGPAFKPGALDRQVVWMSALIAEHLDTWDARADHTASVDMPREFVRLAQSIAGRLLFGSVFAQHAAAVHGMTESLQRFWPTLPRFLQRQTQEEKAAKAARLSEAIAALDAEFFAMMDEALSGEACMLTTLRAAAAEGCEPFTPGEICDQLKTLFFAGYETTATSMTWTHYLMARHPAVHKQVQQEVDRIAPSHTLTPEELDAMPYVEQVFKESLRLYSPIHSLSRVATEECELGGYRVPKGATVMVSLYASHRLPKYWPDPERFDPERFSTEQSAARNRYSYLPFAAGHRNCIGALLAVVEAKLIIAQIARRFELHLVSDAPVHPRPGTTMHPSRAIPMRIEPRAKA